MTNSYKDNHLKAVFSPLKLIEKMCATIIVRTNTVFINKLKINQFVTIFRENLVKLYGKCNSETWKKLYNLTWFTSENYLKLVIS